MDYRKQNDADCVLFNYQLSLLSGTRTYPVPGIVFYNQTFFTGRLKTIFNYFKMKYILLEI